MTRHGRKNRKWEQAIAALLTCKTIEDAAIELRVSKSTLLRWKEDAEFAEAFRKAQAAILEDAKSCLRDGAPKAAEVLVAVATDPAQNGSTRVSAARAIFEILQRGREIEDIEQAVRELEAQGNGDTL